MSKLVEVERDRGVARVWLNRPERHNALNHEFAEELIESFHAVAHDETTSVVVLGGRGKSFCAGADIATMRDSGGLSQDENIAEAVRLGGLFASLAGIPKPVVARIHGNVFGGGVGLMSACDIVVAAADSTFAISEVRLGIIPALISPYLIRRMGDARAREYMLTGERFGAAQAFQIGLVGHVVPTEELDAKVEERVLALASGGPVAQARIKMLLELFGDAGWEEYRGALPRILSEVRAGEEAREGLTAFLEKRKPAWVK